MKLLYILTRIVLAALITITLALSTVSAQNDTMYVMKNGVVINKQSIKASDVDSIIFYDPATSETAFVTDIDGNVYQTVTIGTQTWMVENLKTTKYNDGTAIPLVTGVTEWAGLSDHGYCWQQNEFVTYAESYGALYNFYAVSSGKLCPVGWHVSTDTEWNTLTDYLEGDSVAGGKLKEMGTANWNSPNTGATNESGFTALPGGNRGANGSFNNVGSFGVWWTPLENTSYQWLMNSDKKKVTRGSNSKKTGCSVRCVKD